MFLKFCKTTENYSFRILYQINYRPTKTDKNSEELLTADRRVEKYKEVLDKICRKFVPNPTSGSNHTNAVSIDQDVRDKRCKKVHEFKLAQSLEESLKDLPDGSLRDVLENCGMFSLFFFLCVFEISINPVQYSFYYWNLILIEKKTVHQLQLNWRKISPMRLWITKSM